ncbi:MAG: hypothetical protein K2H39_05765, partial [Paramuribaculum sp.]|nr:hypothetical protein [Paramuribaculum sp.]
MIKSRGFTWLMILASLAMGWIAYMSGMYVENIASGGMWLPDFDSIVSSRILSAYIAVAGIGACCIIMAAMNKVYNVLRTVSLMFVGLFTVIVAGTPELYVSLDTGVILALVILLCVMLLYSLYLSPLRTRRIFLIFFLLACGVLFDYSFVPFIPVFFIGMSQMRCLNFRTFIAALIGLVTPLWILWGFGLLNLREFQLPNPYALYNLFLAKEDMATFSCIGLTLGVGLILGCCNLMKMIAFNARNRAFTGVWSLMGIVTGTLCIVDFTNIWAYVPLLDVCVAFQAGLFMRLFESKRAY